MPPNNGGQPRRGTGQRRAAESRSSDAQGNSNPVIQPAIPQPAQIQNSTRQSSSIANQNDAQRPGLQSQQRNIAPLSSPAGRNNVNISQRYGGAPPTQTPSPARQNSPWGNQNNVPRTVQQPVPMINSLRLSELVLDSPSPPQNSREGRPAQAQSSTRGNSNMANRNNAQTHGQRPEPGFPAPYSGIASNNMNPSQRSVGTPQLWASIVASPASKTTNASLSAGNQAKPEKILFRSPASKEADTLKATETSKEADASKLAATPDFAKTSDGAQERSVSKIYGGQNGTPPNPNGDVTNAENEFIKSGFVPIQQDSEFCVRPGYGSWGTQTVLWTNYLELKLPSKGISLHLYKMIVEPDANNHVPKGDRKRQLVRLLLRDDSVRAIMPEVYATNFNTTIVTKEPLKVEFRKNSVKFGIRFRAEGAIHEPVVPISYTIRIEKAGVLHTSDFENIWRPSKLVWEHHESPALEALNIILGHHAQEADNLARVGSKKMFPFDAQSQIPVLDNLHGGLIALKGFYANAIGATSRVLLNINICHGAFYRSSYLNDGRGSLVNLMWDRCKRNDYEDLHRFLRGLRIKTTHLSREHTAFGKIRIICGLAREGDGANLEKPPEFSGMALGGDPWQVKFHEDFATPSSSSRRPYDDLIRTSPSTERGSMPSRSTNGSYITVKDFFDKAYPNHSARIVENRGFRNPVVNVGTRKKPIYLPAEVCEVLPGQVSRAKLDGHQTSRMIDFAKRDPDECAISIVGEGRKALGYASPPKPMSEFSVTVGHDLITVPGRVLSIPKIEYNASSIVTVREGSWNFAGKQLYQPVPLKLQWQCLRFVIGNPNNNIPPTKSLDGILNDFWSTMTKSGIESQRPLVETTSARSLQSLVSNTEALLKRVSHREANSGPSTQRGIGPNPSAGQPMEKKASDPHLLLIILPSNANELYRSIKTIADVRLGIHTVCVIGDKNDKKRFYGDYRVQYNANVALKINLKLGGMNHTLANHSEALGLIVDQSTMVVGIDVTHPSPGSREGAPSIFAVVASMDRHLSQWPVRLGVQKKSREEVISNGPKLTSMFQDLLKLWRSRNNNSYPENIIVYRDGVSEGQYSAVIAQELAALREACNAFYAKKPRITLIIVAKRHHTRFYPTGDSLADSMKNAKCGTVVDRGITNARTWDFFLQSHSVVSAGNRKPFGTARPGHYVVLRDEVFAHFPKESRADQLQKITHNMCYLYGPATKAISICPPVYLADKACTRARVYLHEAFGSPNQDEVDKRKDKKDERNETDEEKEQREEEERIELQSYQDKIQVHDDLKDTMFYI